MKRLELISDRVFGRRRRREEQRRIEAIRRQILEKAVPEQARRDVAADFRRKRRRAFKGVLSEGEAKRLLRDVRDETAQGRFFAGADNRQRIAAARKAREDS